MKRFFLSLIAYLITGTAIAAVQSLSGVPNEFLLQVDFNYYQQNQNGYVLDRNLQANIKIDSSKNSWVEIAREVTQATSPILLLLSKVEGITDKTVSLRFLIITLSQQGTQVTEPRVHLLWGQAGEIKTNEAMRKMRLILTANKVSESGELISAPLNQAVVVEAPKQAEIAPKKIPKPHNKISSYFHN